MGEQNYFYKGEGVKGREGGLWFFKKILSLGFTEIDSDW